MKFINKSIIALMAASMAFSSCENFLEEEPFESQTELNAFQSVEDVKKALIGSYNSIIEVGADYLHYSMNIPEMMSDNVYNTPSTGGGTVLIFGNFDFTVISGGLENAWFDGYILIDRANFTIAKLEEFTGEDAYLEEQIRGEALALRAMGHFDLLKNFGTSLDRNHSEANSGIPVMLASEVSYPSRNTVAEVYDQIFADLDEAISLLSGKGAVDIYRFNEVSVKALAARVALYAGDYANAAKYADDVITETSLLGADAFVSNWSSVSEGEVLFRAFSKVDDEYITGYWAANEAGVTRRASQELIDLYEAGDARYDAFFLEDATLGTLVKKFSTNDGGAFLQNRSLDVLRVSEMYLISAEAHFRTNNATQALTRLNTLRANRGVANLTSLSEQEILDERRRELAFEGHRFYDLKRLGKDLDRSAMADEPKVTVNNLPAGDKRWVFPIPRRELIVNPNLVQSPMWQ
ncbi:RagB/SusD family nutrient uptake outer membrane protein [Sediminitomix flava]|uniref:SusD-like starch-binding protein associating with outer membrane n=1 Tax=Sediminitomix flava TaxID=379075 RepID=A0A315Z5M3_SEDFL|nr:RagB/SusD family nutrient uptake outer membrane protein [Sediminitomix flava]PWJ39208.1 SusD-like starch-binding protein associating with outer membrane [Sediminitomix flava]